MTDSDADYASAIGQERDGYGLDYPGSGVKCSNCERVGTYLTCSWCGEVMPDAE